MYCTRNKYFKDYTPDMKIITRLKFIKSISVLGLAAPITSFGRIFSESVGSFKFQSPFMTAAMENNSPEFSFLSIDSLGKNESGPSPVLASDKIRKKYKSKISGTSISYWLIDKQQKAPPVWEFNFSEQKIQITSTSNDTADTFNILINQELNHTTVLGVMKKRNKVSLPCLIHLPNMGTFELTCNIDNAEVLVDARRDNRENVVDAKPDFVNISFPPAGNGHPQIMYELKIVSVYPDVPGLKNRSFYDGFRRNFINIFQVNPRLRVLANNSSSDPCAFTLYKSAEVALHTPRLANGLYAMDLVKMTLERYLGGMKAYGLVGFTEKYEDADTVSWKSKYDSLDSYPSLLLSACYYLHSTQDRLWLNEYLKQLINWAEIIVSGDKDNDGLIEYAMSGNYGTWDGHQRPANWWDTIGFGHKDAYSNALAYRALNLFGAILKKANYTDGEKYIAHALKIKSNYYSTFYNAETGVLAGWKSEDGQLHDYYFTFVNGIAITYGLLNEEQGNGIMNKILEKMKAVALTDFSLGLPGNLVPIKKGDYTTDIHRWGGPLQEDGSDAFGIYENGGLTLCYSYFTVKALQKLNRKADAERILLPILDGIDKGRFDGKCENGMSKDWKTWTGECWGYEGFLCDGYMVLLAGLEENKNPTEKVKIFS
jgi:hypothetical protein